MRIGLYGATGSWDFGDYAMMIHNIQEIWNDEPETEFTIFTPDKYITLRNIVDNLQDISKINLVNIVDEPMFTLNRAERIAGKLLRKVTGRDYILWFKYQSFFKGNLTYIPLITRKEMQAVDIMLFNGGGYFQHSWESKNYNFAAGIALANMLGKPVYFMANSIGPLEQFEHVVSDALHLVDRIMIRDGHHFSEIYLKSIGYDRYLNGPDDLTFVNDSYSCTSDYNNYVIIEIMCWIKRAKQGDETVMRAIKKLMDEILAEGKDVVLITFDNTDWTAINCIQNLCREFDGNCHVHAVTHLENIYHVFGLYKYCEFSISMKYHPVILALGSGKPTLGIICDNDGYYEGKLVGAHENLEVYSKEHVIHIDNIKDNSLVERYRLLRDKAPVSASVRSRMKAVRQDYLREILSPHMLG